MMLRGLWLQEDRSMAARMYHQHSCFGATGRADYSPDLMIDRSSPRTRPLTAQPAPRAASPITAIDRALGARSAPSLTIFPSFHLFYIEGEPCAPAYRVLFLAQSRRAKAGADRQGMTSTHRIPITNSNCTAAVGLAIFISRNITKFLFEHLSLYFRDFDTKITNYIFTSSSPGIDEDVHLFGSTVKTEPISANNNEPLTDSGDSGDLGLGPSDEQVRASMIHLLNPVLGSAFGVSCIVH
uniref:Uncharacterized protein n=1 Tax=Heterorhabditis bacteriophora TaxID=37862 RepID=A0A1I7WKI0_HETBA